MGGRIFSNEEKWNHTVFDTVSLKRVYICFPEQNGTVLESQIPFEVSIRHEKYFRLSSRPHLNACFRLSSLFLVFSGCEILDKTIAKKLSTIMCFFSCFALDCHWHLCLGLEGTGFLKKHYFFLIFVLYLCCTLITCAEWCSPRWLCPTHHIFISQILNLSKFEAVGGKKIFCTFHDYENCWGCW